MANGDPESALAALVLVGYGVFRRPLSVKWHNGHFHVQYMAFALRGWSYGPDGLIWVWGPCE
jgi:hypothetical protein